MRGAAYVLQGVILGKEVANGLAINLASGEMDEALAVLPAVLHHGERIHEVAIDGIQRTRVVISWRADRCQVDNLNTYMLHYENHFIQGSQRPTLLHFQCKGNKSSQTLLFTPLSRRPRKTNTSEVKITVSLANATASREITSQ